MKIDENKPLEAQWDSLLIELENRIGKKPGDLNAILFLIGVQELGHGVKTFSKEQKQDLMHVGICTVLGLSGYYEVEGRDSDGWPHFRLSRSLPSGDLLAQESLLKMHVLEYFKSELGEG